MTSRPQPAASIWLYSTTTVLITFLALSLIGVYRTFQTGEPRIVYSRKPARCYTCNNYASVGAGVNPRTAPHLSWVGGKPILGGWSRVASLAENENGLTPLQMASLCTEKVNRSAIPSLIDSEEYGQCPNGNYDGCAKLVTKSFRVRSQVGRAVLTSTVVSRTCAVIPKGFGVGCFKSIGGAGMRRTVCYCQGEFCNSARRLELPSFTPVFATLLLVGISNSDKL